MEGVYTKARSEEVVPEMRSALSKACAGSEVEIFVKDLGRDVCADSSEALGAEKGRGCSKLVPPFSLRARVSCSRGCVPLQGHFLAPDG